MVNKHLFSCLRKVIFVSPLKIQGYQNISKRIYLTFVEVKRATHSRLCGLGEILFRGEVARLIRQRRCRPNNARIVTPIEIQSMDSRNVTNLKSFN